MKYNTRIAPSPTGFAHLGTIRTAYFNWLAAKASGGSFILRIDDTDLSRSDPKYSHAILDAIDWLGLQYDQLIRQSQRFDLYRSIADDLVSQGKAKKDGFSVVLYPTDIPDAWYDELSKFVLISQDDKDSIKRGVVLIKSDGSPTYHFANVVDDYKLNINFVIRGVDHITNTSRQIAIYHALGIADHIPKYAHVGLVHKDGKKLSKRETATNVLWYRDSGYDPDALLNFMARLGWGPTVDDKTTSLLPRDKMVQLFICGGKMKSSSANVDMAKLDSFDRKYKARKKISVV